MDENKSTNTAQATEGVQEKQRTEREKMIDEIRRKSEEANEAMREGK